MNVGVCTFVRRRPDFAPILVSMEAAAQKTGSGRARVLIADDHDLIRQALRAVIDEEPDMEVIGEACDGEQAVAMALELKPDAMVMDIQMPKLSGVEATGRIKKLLPDVTILVLTVHDSNEYILRILEAGASGYLTKGIISKDIPAAIRAAINGESILSEEILRKLINYALRYPTRQQQAEETPTTLTERETEILQLVAQGASNKVIASELNLSQNTIKKYMMGIFAKLGATSRTGAVISAQQIGLLSRHE
jgi:DNA-binding NarL/FixJ family response regulator